MTKDEIRDKEFDYLRKEIEFYLSKINSMTNLLYVSVTAILAWAIESQNPLFCSSVFCIIIPSYIVAHSYNIGMLKIGAYLIVFYEDYKWESRSHIVNQQVQKKFNRLPASYRFPYIFVGILSGISSWIIFLGNHSNLQNYVLWFNSIGITIICIIFILILLKQKGTDEIKQFYKDEWTKVREEEQHNKNQDI